jgi:hypothetical protein
MTAVAELPATPAVNAALGALREATGGTDGPMERHCLRVRRIAAELARRRGWAIDDEVIAVAAMLHDVGLYPSASRGGVYTADGAALAREMLRAHSWSDDRIRLCAEAIDRHHELRGQRAHGDEVEALRLADLIDLGAGLLTFGLDRRWLRDLNRDVPRQGLVAELVRELGRAFGERPLTIPRIFWCT